MEKYFWKITNYLFVSIITLFVLLMLFFCFKTTINNIFYYNEFIKGIVIEIENREANTSNGPLYLEKIYTIKKGNTRYKSTAVDQEVKISLFDSISGIKKSNKLIRILTVNSIQINNKYNIADFVSLFITLIFTVALIFFLTKIIK